MNRQICVLTLLLSLSLTACDDIFVEDISDNEVTLVAPANHVVLNNADVTLVWDTLEGAEQYQVIVVSPSFDRIESYVCDSITDDYKLKVTLTSGEYEWSVQAHNSAYSSLKSIGSFEVEIP